MSPQPTQGQQLPSIRVVISHFLALASIFILLSVPIVISVCTAAILTIQSLVGQLLLSRYIPSFAPTSSTLLGPSFIVGTAIFVIPVQILGSGQHLIRLTFLLMLTFLIFCYSKKARTQPVHSENTYLLTFGFAFLIMSNEWPFFAIVGILLIFGHLTLPFFDSIPKIGAFLSITFGIAILALLRFFINYQGNYWWLITDDYSYYAALQFHLANFGIYESFGPTNIAMYHWLSPAWTGQISSLVGGGSWEILTRVAPVTLSLAIASSTLLLLRKYLANPSKKMTVRTVVAIAWLFLFLKIDFAGTSTVAAFAVLSATMLVLSYVCDFYINYRNRILCFIILLPILIFTKVFAATAFCVFATGFIALPPQRQKIQQKLILGAAILFLTIFWLLLPFLGHQLSEGWATELRINSNVFRNQLLPAVHYCVPVGIALLIVATNHGNNKFQNLVIPVGVSLIVTLSIFLLIHPTFAGDIVNYFTKPTIYIAGIFLVITTSETSEEFGTSDWHPRLLPFSSGVLLAGLSFPYFPEIRNLVKRTQDDFSILGKVSVITIIFLIGCGASILIFSIECWRVTRKTSSPSTFFTAVFGMSLAFVSMMIVGHTSRFFDRDNSPWQDRNSELALAQLGDPALEEIGIWIRFNTSQSAMIATSELCTSTVSLKNDGTRTLQNAKCDLGVDYTLGHTSQRRFLVLGPRFAYQNIKLRDKKVAQSLDYFLQPSLTTHDQLVNQGVDYFVASQQSNALMSSDAGQIVFQNTKYKIIKLR